MNQERHLREVLNRLAADPESALRGRTSPRATPPVEDDGWSPDIAIQSLQLILAEADYRWAESAAGQLAARNLRAVRLEVARASIAEIRDRAHSVFVAWRDRAARRGDYSGRDPILDLAVLHVTLAAVWLVCHCEIGFGWHCRGRAALLQRCAEAMAPLVRAAATAEAAEGS